MFPAARKGDPITHDMVVPSGLIGPPVTGPCPPPFTPVVIEALPAAHMLCTAVCTGATVAGLIHPPPVPPAPPPPIVVGSATVLIHGRPAARWVPSGDVAACGTFLGDLKLAATRTVLIGGPGVGASLGNPATTANNACVTAAAGRPGGSTQQSDNNCGVESARQIINQANGTAVPERTLLDQSMNNGDAIRVRSGPWWRFWNRPTNYPASGGTYPSGQVNILSNNGVPAHNEAATMPNIASAVSAGRGVIVQIDAAPVWNGNPAPGSGITAPGAWHAVTVTGVQYNGSGNIVSVTINDTGNLPPNNCQQTIPIATFQAAMAAYQAAPGTSTNSTVVTDNPVF